jgi:hypothetical protein
MRCDVRMSCVGSRRLCLNVISTVVWCSRGSPSLRERRSHVLPRPSRHADVRARHRSRNADIHTARARRRDSHQRLAVLHGVRAVSKRASRVWRVFAFLPLFALCADVERAAWWQTTGHCGGATTLARAGQAKRRPDRGDRSAERAGDRVNQAHATRAIAVGMLRFDPVQIIPTEAQLLPVGQWTNSGTLTNRNGLARFPPRDRHRMCPHRWVEVGSLSVFRSAGLSCRCADSPASPHVHLQST